MAIKGVSAGKSSAEVDKGVPAFVMTILATVGPYIAKKILELIEDPEKRQEILDWLTKHFAPKSLSETIDALQEEVDYLAESADDDAERARAAKWKKELDQCASAVRLLRASAATKDQKKAVKKKIAELNRKILAAVIEEKAEDARSADVNSDGAERV